MFCTRGIRILALVALILTSADSAHATCTLYEGDNALPSVKERLKQISEALPQLPDTERDYCQAAHLEYRMSRWLPEKAEHHLTRCMENANHALQVIDRNESGTAFFLRGLCRGRLGEANGFWASIDVITPFQKDMTMAMHIDPSVDFGGPHRALGKLYYELPFFMGGDMKQSIEHLEKAVEIGPGYWENHFYLAQSYMSDGRYREAQKQLERANSLAQDIHDTPDIESDKKEIQQLIEEVNRYLE